MSDYLKELELIRDWVGEQMGIDINRNTRKKEYATGRALYFIIARERTNFSLAEIGSLVGKNHATVLHWLAKHNLIYIKGLYNVIYERSKDVLYIIDTNNRKRENYAAGLLKRIQFLRDDNKKLRDENETLKATLNDDALITYSKIRDKKRVKEMLKTQLKLQESEKRMIGFSYLSY